MRITLPVLLALVVGFVLGTTVDFAPAREGPGPSNAPGKRPALTEVVSDPPGPSAATNPASEHDSKPVEPRAARTAGFSPSRSKHSRMSLIVCGTVSFAMLPIDTHATTRHSGQASAMVSASSMPSAIVSTSPSGASFSGLSDAPRHSGISPPSTAPSTFFAALIRALPRPSGAR